MTRDVEDAIPYTWDQPKKEPHRGSFYFDFFLENRYTILRNTPERSFL